MKQFYILIIFLSLQITSFAQHDNTFKIVKVNLDNSQYKEQLKAVLGESGKVIGYKNTDSEEALFVKFLRFEDIKIPFENVEPFIAYSIVIHSEQWSKNLDAINVRAKIPLNDEISTYEAIKPNAHFTQSNSSKVVSELYYLNSTKPISLNLFSPKGIFDFSEIEIHFYHPGKTEDIKEPEDEPISMTENSCPCPQPTFQNRVAWCPAGNCPPHSSPSMTNVSHLIIHHSAGTNTSNDWAAVVRSIWNYHVNTNGWADIGYNWLVDPNGVLYEGRGDNIQGAHFCGTNGATIGVCVLGNFMTVAPTTNATDKLTELLAWKACDIGANPLTSSTHSGSGLNLQHISGHRDGCATSCPGDMFYPMLTGIRTDVQTYIDSCQTSQPALQAPTNLAANALSPTLVELTWDDNSTTEDGFIIERSEQFNTNYMEVGSVPADSTTFINTGLTPFTAYFYKVKTFNATDTSGFSNEVFIATPQNTNLSNMESSTSIQVFPNPIDDFLNVQINSEWIGDGVFEVLDVTGKVVLPQQAFSKTTPIFNQQINSEKLTRGVYIINIMMNGDVWSAKVMK